MTDKQITTEENSDKNERQSANWDLSNVVRNYSTLVAAQIASAFFSFASVWLATRFLGTEGYGGIVAVIAASQVAQIFVNWTCVALARYGVEEFVESGKISNTFWARTLIFLPNTLIFLAFSFLWLPLISSWLKLPAEAFWYIAAHFFVAAVWSHVQHALQGAKLLRLQGILLAVERISIFSGLLILALSGALTYLSAITIYIAAPFLMIFIGLFQLRKLISGRVRVDADALRKILKFSVPLIPFALVGYLSTNYLDAIFISQFLSKSDLGVYSIAYQFNGILMQFPTLAGTLLMPLFVTLQNSKRENLIERYFVDILPLMTLAWGIICIIVALSGKFFLPVIFGHEVSEADEVLGILVISSAITFPSFVGFIPFVSKISATYIGALMAIGAAATNLAANYFLIPRYGLAGCAWATVLASFVSTLIVFLILRFRYSVGHRWTWQALLPVVIVCSYYAWSGNVIFSVLIGLVTTLLLILIYRHSFEKGVRLLINYRRHTE